MLNEDQIQPHRLRIHAVIGYYPPIENAHVSTMPDLLFLAEAAMTCDVEGCVE